jgi:hypothetical protein
MDRIELADHPHRRLRSWESGERGHWRHVTVELGVLDGGRWYVAQTSRRGTKAWQAQTERQACTAVEAWMRRLGTGWRETTGQDA